MTSRSGVLRVAGLLAVAGAVAVLPGCTGAAPPAPTAPAVQPVRPGPRPAEADVRFMQGMTPHHAQALDMAALVPARSTSRALHLLAERIAVSQADEIAWMRRWLRDRGAEAPDPGAPHHHDGGPHALMPGMLTPEEMARLAAATGAAFDRLFLHLMIRHHEGALTMVAELLASEGAAQATEVYRFASDVEADQRAEIGRMRALLATLPPADDGH